MFKKINVSTFLGNNLLRRALSICPALEKMRSAGTKVAGTIKYLSAMSLSGANTTLCSFQNLATLLLKLDEAYLCTASLRM